MTLAHLAAFAIETRRAEHALLEMRQRNELIPAASADGIVGLAAEGLVTYANQAAAALLERGPAEMIGPSVHTFLRPLRVGRTHDLTTAPTTLGRRTGQE